MGCRAVLLKAPIARPQRGGNGPKGRALPAPACTGRKDKTQTCSSQDLSLY